MDRGELIQRYHEVHNATLMLVQKFSKADFERPAPAAAWSAKDLFAHLAQSNREAQKAVEALKAGSTAAILPQCRDIQPNGKNLTLAKTMEEFRLSHKTLAQQCLRVPSARFPSAAAVLENAIRHYQIHQNDLNLLIGALRPH